MSQITSPRVEVARRPRPRPMGMINTLVAQQLHKGYDLAAQSARFIQRCLHTDGKETLTRNGSTVSRTEQDNQGLSSGSGLDAPRTRGFTEDSVPDFVLQSFSDYRSAQRRKLEVQRWLEAQDEPAKELGVKLRHAIAQVRERMEANREQDGARRDWDLMGQRLDNLRHCHLTLERQAEDGIARLEELKIEELDAASVLGASLEKWLAYIAKREENQMQVDPPEYKVPFDLKVINEAHEACERQKVKDDSRLEWLRNRPFQNVEGEEALLSKYDLRRVSCAKVQEYRSGLEQSNGWLERAQERREARENGNLDSEWEPEEADGDNFDLGEKITEVEEDIEVWKTNIAYAVEAARDVGCDVTSHGTVITDRFFDRDAGEVGGDEVLWGVDEPDKEQDPSPEQELEIRVNAEEKVKPWQIATNFEVVPEDVPASPTTPNVDLTEAQISDSASNIDPFEKPDFGYSIYRVQLDQMERLREDARAALPEDAKPAADDLDDVDMAVESSSAEILHYQKMPPMVYAPVMEK